MAIQIGGYSFEGPHDSTENLRDQSGVYAILTKDWRGQYNVLDIGESAVVRSRIESHDRKDCGRYLMEPRQPSLCRRTER